jgi:hypothetical protein
MYNNHQEAESGPIHPTLPITLYSNYRNYLALWSGRFLLASHHHYHPFNCQPLRFLADFPYFEKIK